MSNEPELPEEWVAEGWTPETAGKADEKHSAPWGDASADVTAADPSSVESEQS
jgi:hypothetical protein